MKIKFLLLAFLTVTIGFGQNQSSFFNRADIFFKMYTKDGRVNYKALRENQEHLNWLVDYIATENINPTTKKAYLINAYNILVIDKIVDHSKLVSSPEKIGGFFDTKTAMVEGMKVSLNQIENEMIRRSYKDPRVHFVLVCGGLGCPPIANFAYRPKQLDKQLNNQTKIAFNNSDFVYEDEDKKSIYISKIFEWYQSDFAQTPIGVVDYINTYRDAPFNTKYKVKYYDYDWDLNSAEFKIIPIKYEDKGESLEGVEVNNNDNMLNTENNIDVVTEDSPIQSNNVSNIPIEEFDLQQFTAGSLLGKGKFDFTLFNTIYTENHQIWQEQTFSGYRSTFVTHLLQTTYGITESKRINVGLDINFKSSGKSAIDSTYGGISRAFAYENNDSSRVGFTSIGARIKVQPFAAVSNFSIQSTIFVPIIKHPEGFQDPSGTNNLFWAEWDRITWWNQLFIDKSFGKFQLFAELDFLFRFKRYKNQIGMLDMPAAVFFSYFPTKKITVYAMTQHVARFTNNINGHSPTITDWVIPMNYTASGLGFKYQLRSNLNLEILYTNFWRGANSGLGETFNIGLKFLTR